MKNIKLIIKLITGIILIFLLSASVPAAEECEKMQATFSWAASGEEVVSKTTITSGDVGKVMSCCPMFEIEEFKSEKLVLSCPQDESISAVITSRDIGKKPVYSDEFGSNTICNLELIDFDGNSATFGILESIEEIKNRTVTSDDVGVEFELNDCKIIVNEFDLNSQKISIGIDDKCSGRYQDDYIKKILTSGDSGEDIFFSCCKFKLENIRCLAVEDTPVDKESEPEKEDSGGKYEQNFEENIDPGTEEKENPPGDNEVQNIGIGIEQKIEQKDDLKKDKSPGSCSGLDAGIFCIPAFVLIAVMLIVIIFLVLLIFFLIKK